MACAWTEKNCQEALAENYPSSTAFNVEAMVINADRTELNTSTTYSTGIYFHKKINNIVFVWKCSTTVQ